MQKSFTTQRKGKEGGRKTPEDTEFLPVWKKKDNCPIVLKLTKFTPIHQQEITMVINSEQQDHVHRQGFCTTQNIVKY